MPVILTFKVSKLMPKKAYVQLVTEQNGLHKNYKHTHKGCLYKTHAYPPQYRVFSCGCGQEKYVAVAIKFCIPKVTGSEFL